MTASRESGEAVLDRKFVMAQVFLPAVGSPRSRLLHRVSPYLGVLALLSADGGIPF